MDGWRTKLTLNTGGASKYLNKDQALTGMFAPAIPIRLLSVFSGPAVLTPRYTMLHFYT